ncbi:hypothetical protein [Bradyrhizobium sp. HKCCYLS20291]|uniref:hypothetical protein n=1 Tax=Bradyrhizobium sp. HKCCYLS20291 TaxID=3420766 RepID=UPI003EBBD81D
MAKKTVETALRSCAVHIESVSPYSASRAHEEEKLANETHDDYDRRTWRHKLTTDANGMVVIPRGGFKQAIDGAAKMVGGKIPGKGNATYSKLFTTGVLVEGDVELGVHANDVESIRIHANADGIRGSGKRVFRIFPILPTWSGVVNVLITDPELPEEVFERVMTAAGRCQGVGRWRPEKGGSNGRFTVSKFEWSNVA